MPLSKSYDYLFVEPENKSTEWDSKFVDYGSSNNPKKLKKHSATANKIYFPERKIFITIDTFTYENVSDNEKMDYINDLKKENFVKDIEVTDYSIKIKTTKGNFNALKLSETFIELENNTTLQTEARKGKCHFASLNISERLPFDNNVVTGNVYGYSDQAKYLHTWIEFEDSDKSFVIDYTLNAIMNKDGYYKMLHAEPLQKISKENVIKDKTGNLFNNLRYAQKFGIKEYLVYRDELVKDMNKNKKIFDEDLER